jgi:hypothetical protein
LYPYAPPAALTLNKTYGLRSDRAARLSSAAFPNPALGLDRMPCPAPFGAKYGLRHRAGQAPQAAAAWRERPECAAP